MLAILLAVWSSVVAGQLCSLDVGTMNAIKNELISGGNAAFAAANMSSSDPDFWTGDSGTSTVECAGNRVTRL